MPRTAAPIRLSLLFVLGLTAGLTPFAIDLYLPSIPAIAADLGASVELVQLSVTVYLAVFALAQIFLGPLSDVLGRRATVLGGASLFLIANLGCILAPDLGWLLGARAVQALGGAAVAVTIPALVRDLFGKNDYARIMGMVMMVMAAAPLLAPTFGSAILAFAHWRWIFVALATLALLAGGLFAALVPETLPVGQRHSFGLGRILRNYGTLLQHGDGLGYLLTVSFSFAGMIVFITTSPYVYISLHGVPPQWFGILFGVNILAAMGLSTLNTWLIPRLGADRMLGLGMLLQGGATVLLLGLGVWALLGTGPPLWIIALAVLAYIAAMGLVMGNAMAGFMAYFPGLAGTASAFGGALRFGLGALMGSLASLAHNDSAAPLLLGMAACGLTAVGWYLGRCCRR
jgi:MFS transporter, DHA1 family, multidrug resistance protein